MRTIYLAFAIIVLTLFATSCRSRQVSHQMHEFAQAPQAQQPAAAREAAPPRPVVQVSYRQAEGQAAVRQTPAPPVVAQTPTQPRPTPAPTPTVTRLAPDGQTNVGVTFIESPAPVRQPVAQPAVRQENINALFATDASDLRRYSVVVASLSNRWNAETLQRRLQNDGHHVILAQNERGMFRVIVGSFDNRFQAVAQKDELRRRYSAMGSPDFLVRTYGIPFNDLWILGRHF